MKKFFKNSHFLFDFTWFSWRWHYLLILLRKSGKCFDQTMYLQFIRGCQQMTPHYQEWKRFKNYDKIWEIQLKSELVETLLFSKYFEAVSTTLNSSSSRTRQKTSSFMKAICWIKTKFFISFCSLPILFCFQKYNLDYLWGKLNVTDWLKTNSTLFFHLLFNICFNFGHYFCFDH